MKNKSEIRSFNSLYNSYSKRFIRFANSYVEDLPMAEDITMESLMTYWENRDSLTHDSNIPAYILTIIKNKCLNHLRHLNIQRTAEEYIYDTDSWELRLRLSTLEACNPALIFSNEIHQIVKEALTTLPQQTRDIFEKSRFENLSHKEIAEQLGISTKSVEFHITKALKNLRIALKDYFPLFLLLYRFTS